MTGLNGPVELPGLAIGAWAVFYLAPMAMNAVFASRRPELILIDGGYVLAGLLLNAVSQLALG